MTNHHADKGRAGRLARATGFLSIALVFGWSAADPRDPTVEPGQATTDAQARAVDPAHFIREALLEDLTLEERALSDGSRAMCLVLQSGSRPYEHPMGPWSPKHVSDGKEAGGIWMKDGELYDVDGPFLAAIADLYSDPAWNLVRDDGSIRVTATKEAFEAAARPDVDPRYHNHVVEGRPEWIEEKRTTFVIPVQPVYSTTPIPVGRGAVGVAFNGVQFDPPAPLHAILAAHTIAPLDDSGGHLNPHAGYHYHAATGHTKEVPQADGHAAMIGYALDGFAIHAHLDEDGTEPQGLDECGGHVDALRGYHYHAGTPGSNQIIRAFRGVPGTALGQGEGPGASGPPPPPAHGRLRDGKGRSSPRRRGPTPLRGERWLWRGSAAPAPVADLGHVQAVLADVELESGVRCQTPSSTSAESCGLPWQPTALVEEGV